MYKLVLNRAAKSVFQCDWRNKTRALYVLADKISVLRELFYADCADGKLPPRKERKQVEAQAAKIRERVRKMEEPLFRFAVAIIHIAALMLIDNSNQLHT